MFEDGTPSRWLDGLGDCFSSHDSFDDLRQAANDRRQSASVPREEAARLAREGPVRHTEHLRERGRVRGQ